MNLNPTNMLRCAVPAALEAGRAIMEVYNRPEADWEVERKADDTPLTLADRRAHEIIVRHPRRSSYPVLSEEGKLSPYDERKSWERLWIVDPLDGTEEFLQRNGEFTVNIAFVEKGKPVCGVIYVPATRTLYYGFAEFGAFKIGDTSVLKTDADIIRQAQRLPVGRSAKGFVCVASRSHLSAETEAYITLLRHRHGDLQLISAGSSLKLCRIAEGSADVYPRFAPTMEWDTAAGDAIVRAAGGRMLAAHTDQPLVYNKEDLRNPDFVCSR